MIKKFALGAVVLVTNGFGDLERVAVRESMTKCDRGKIEHGFEGLSLTVLRWTVVK